MDLEIHSMKAIFPENKPPCYFFSKGAASFKLTHYPALQLDLLLATANEPTSQGHHCPIRAWRRLRSGGVEPRRQLYRIFQQNSFSWRGEISADGGKTWRTEQEMMLKRRAAMS